jgi:hypothetical protein
VFRKRNLLGPTGAQFVTILPIRLLPGAHQSELADQIPTNLNITTQQL